MSVISKANARTYQPEIAVEFPEAVGARPEVLAPDTMPAEILDYSALDAEKPGISGLHPLALILAMLIGLMMWAGIFYLGYTALNFIF